MLDFCRKHSHEVMRIFKTRKKNRALGNVKAKGSGYKHDWQKIRDALMAATDKGKTTTASAVARQLKIPGYAAARIAKELVKTGRLKSTGRGAGRKLSRP